MYCVLIGLIGLIDLIGFYKIKIEIEKYIKT